MARRLTSRDGFVWAQLRPIYQTKDKPLSLPCESKLRKNSIRDILDGPDRPAALRLAWRLAEAWSPREMLEGKARIEAARKGVKVLL